MAHLKIKVPAVEVGRVVNVLTFFTEFPSSDPADIKICQSAFSTSLRKYSRTLV